MPEPPKLSPIADAPISVILLDTQALPDALSVVARWAAHLEALGRGWELIVAGNPALSERVADVLSRYPQVRVLADAGHVGDGSALRAALPHAHHPLLLIALLDPQFPPDDLDKLLANPLKGDKPGLEIDHVHIIGAYRAGRPVPLPLRCLSLVGRALAWALFSYFPPPLPGSLGWRARLGWVVTRLLFGARYHDVGCPFRLFRREIFERIPIQSDGAFVHVEVLAKANFLGHMMGEEVPLREHPPLGAVRPGASYRQWWRDFRRVLAQPDFGPAVLPAPKEEVPSRPPEDVPPTAEPGLLPPQ